MLVERAGRIGLRGRLRRLLRIPFRRLEMKMKRLLILLILAMTIFEPKPVEVKPVLTTEIKPPWTIGKTVVGYYQRVKMPDGTTQELKSKTPLDIKGWEALAQKQWEAMKAVELSLPENCMDCHAGCGRKP